MHGAPGCGKTSMIKAIANMTKRHIVNLSLHSFLTRAQLNNLFFTNKLYIETADKVVPETFIIPNDKRIYVIEDIDCMSDIVLQRQELEPVTPDNNPIKKTMLDDPSLDPIKKKLFDDSLDPTKKTMLFEDPPPNAQTFKKVDIQKIMNPNEVKMDETRKKMESYSSMREKMESDGVTLSFLLNLLDGVLEVKDRILIISSNHPEKLDKALIRPGRIDLAIEFKKCDKQVVKDMATNFYDIDDINTSNIIEDKYTPAEVSQAFLKNFNDHKKAIEYLST